MKTGGKKSLVPFSWRPSEKGTDSDAFPAGQPLVVAGVRRRWSQDVCRHCQEFTGWFLPDGPHPTEQRISDMFAHMPAPIRPDEMVFLQSILTRLALGIWATAVSRDTLESRTADRRSRDALTRMRSIAPRWDGGTRAEWTAVCRDLVAQVWPRWAALQAAALLADRFTEAWTLPLLAATLDCDAASLDREFRRQFGMPPRDYLVRIRVVAAIRLLEEGMKVECVPPAVGYQSRKNLNHALDRLTGLRPSEVRLLTPTELAGVRRRLAIPASEMR